MVHRDGNRQKRVAEVLQRALAVIIPREVNDPRVGEVTITGVEVSPDLKNARVFITLWDRQQQNVGDQDKSGKDKQQDKRKLVEALNQAGGFLRHRLRAEVDLRGIPGLSFVYDESVDRGNRIEELLASSRNRNAGKKLN